METNSNPFQVKMENYNESISIIGKWEGCEEATREYFGEWIENVGGWDEWLSRGFLEETEEEPWDHPVPEIQTQFGNYVFDPAYHKWLDEEELWDRIEDHQSNS